MIMWFGVGAGLEDRDGRGLLLLPGRDQRGGGHARDRPRADPRRAAASARRTWHMVTKIYLPAMRAPILNGIRLGLGVAIIGTLLAETKLSNRGLGFLVIQAYATFDMPRMYALLIVLFVLSIGVNALIGRLGRGRGAVAVLTRLSHREGSIAHERRDAASPGPRAARASRRLSRRPMARSDRRSRRAHVESEHGCLPRRRCRGVGAGRGRRGRGRAARLRRVEGGRAARARADPARGRGDPAQACATNWP